MNILVEAFLCCTNDVYSCIIKSMLPWDIEEHLIPIPNNNFPMTPTMQILPMYQLSCL